MSKEAGACNSPNNSWELSGLFDLGHIVLVISRCGARSFRPDRSLSENLVCSFDTSAAGHTHTHIYIILCIYIYVCTNDIV